MAYRNAAPYRVWWHSIVAPFRGADIYENTFTKILSGGSVPDNLPSEKKLPHSPGVLL